MSIESVMLSNHLILCHAICLLSSIFPIISLLKWEVSQFFIWGSQIWRFSFRNSPSNEYSRFISLKIDGFDFFAIQRTLKSSPAPQYESINVHSSTIYNSRHTEATQVPINRWMEKNRCEWIRNGILLIHAILRNVHGPRECHGARTSPLTRPF